MPALKHYHYKKILECEICSYYKNQICSSPLPGINTCKYKTIKTWNHTWYFKTCIYGRQYIRRGYPSKNEALKAEIEFRKEMLGQRIYRSHEQFPSFRETIIKYGEYQKGNVKGSYGTNITRSIENYYSLLLPDIPINKLLKCHADNLRKTIDKEKISVRTKNDKLDFMKRFFIYVENVYHYRFNEIFLLNKFKDYSIKRTPLTKKVVEFDEFIQIFKTCDSSYYRLALLIMFLFGLRLGEQLGLQVNSFNFKTETFETYQTANFKTGNGSFKLESPKTPESDRHHLMPSILVNLIKKHIKEHNLKKDDFIFFRYKTQKSEENHKIPIHENTFRKECEKYCRLYNKDFHPHMLRTSAVTHFREKGVPLEEISMFVGHKETRVTDLYYSKTSLNKEKLINIAIEENLKKIL